MNLYLTYLFDTATLTGIAVGAVGALVAGSIVLARIVQAFGGWNARNAR